MGIGGTNVPMVFADYSQREIKEHRDLTGIGYLYEPATDKWNMTDQAADIIYLGKQVPPFDLPMGIKVVSDYDQWLKTQNEAKSFPLMNEGEYRSNKQKSETLNFVEFDIHSIDSDLISKLKNDNRVVIVLTTNNKHAMAEQRRVFMKLIENEIKHPVIIKRSYYNLTSDELRLYSSTDIGALLIDGFGDGVWINTKNILEPAEQENEYVKRFITIKETNESLVNRTLFGILQSARVRISKTEYIACPSCGRTLFDLQETTDMIRKRTEHLKGVKIAIMGCIVNGPGEMADADYGYVGSGIDKITLYKGKEIVRRNIPTENAVDSLIEIIKEDNNWIEPK
jgi:(E)-4-hydroxy-3-methylbut-2-enyl-diphosphate synthase